MLKKVFGIKKLNFWRLAFIFIGLTITVLFLLWNSPYEPRAQMMNGSMGNMMKQMHISKATIYDLFTSDGIQKAQTESQSNDSNHQDQDDGMVKINFLTTMIIFILLPLIIGGSIILAIVWIK